MSKEFLRRTHEAPVNVSYRMFSASYFQSYYNPICSLEENGSLKNQLIICTGGNCGIGYETVKELSLRGADVVIVARNQVKNEETVNRIQKLIESSGSYGSISFIQLDLSDMNSIVNCVSEIKSRYKDRKVDQLIQNAGFMNLCFGKFIRCLAIHVLHIYTGSRNLLCHKCPWSSSIL